MSANAAAFAIIHIRREKTVLALLNTSFRTKHITDSTLDAFLVVPNRALRTPTSRMIFTGASRLGNNAANGKLFPCFQCHNGYTP